MLLIRRLVWDPENVAHIARYDVVPEEVEQACHGHPVTQAGKRDRLLVFGPTDAARMLTLVLDATEVSGVYYVVTARPASRRERRIYANERKGGETI